MTSSICNVSDFHSYVQNTFLTKLPFLINFDVSYILIYFCNDNSVVTDNRNMYPNCSIENVEIRICFMHTDSYRYFTFGSFDCNFTGTTLSEQKAPKKIRDKAYKLKSKLLKYFSNALIEIDTTIHNFNN